VRFVLSELDEGANNKWAGLRWGDFLSGLVSRRGREGGRGGGLPPDKRLGRRTIDGCGGGDRDAGGILNNKLLLGELPPNMASGEVTKPSRVKGGDRC
jgi:hypothetical protein